MTVCFPHSIFIWEACIIILYGNFHGWKNCPSPILYWFVQYFLASLCPQKPQKCFFCGLQSENYCLFCCFDCPSVGHWEPLTCLTFWALLYFLATQGTPGPQDHPVPSAINWFSEGPGSICWLIIFRSQELGVWWHLYTTGFSIFQQTELGNISVYILIHAYTNQFPPIYWSIELLCLLSFKTFESNSSPKPHYSFYFPTFLTCTFFPQTIRHSYCLVY